MTTTAPNTGAEDARTKGAGRRTDGPQRLGAIRENLVSFASAIALVVLFKFFVIEAYMIPTGSMQPTLMGSTDAGVFDRLFVDKRAYEHRDPERWDVVVFRYPIRFFQNYVKRIVGTGGDTIRVAGGNLYLVDESAEGSLTPLRKPDAIQEGLWRNLFPAAVELDGDDPLGDVLRGASLDDWELLAGTKDSVRLREATRFVRRLVFGREPHAIVNQVWDGYPTKTALAIRAAKNGARTASGAPPEYVQDVRIGARVTPEGKTERVTFEIEIDEGAGARKIVHALTLEPTAGTGRLTTSVDGKVTLRSDPFELRLAGQRISFEHRDDLCRAFVDGEEVASLDTSTVRTLQALTYGATKGAGVYARLEVEKSDPITLADITVDRDLHYLPGAEKDTFRVPDGHYFMMGDNTQESVDGRDWTAVEVAVGADGQVLDPRTAPAELPRLRGNFRPRAVGGEVDADENPVPVVTRDMVAFTDEVGENHALKGRVSQQPGTTWGEAGVWFLGPDDQPWEAPESYDHFVRREHILGRALFVWWPYDRIGPVR